MKNKLVLLRSFSNEVDAMVAKSHLEASGVFVAVKKDDVGGMQPSFQLTGGVSLMVRAKDEKRANQILRIMKV